MPQYLFYPSIDPLSEKNRELEPGIVENTLRRFQIDPLRPIITQISRFDRLKDPVGVVRAYLIVKRYTDCQLVLAGGGATDDPEGDAVLAEVRETAGKDPDIHILDLPPWSAVEINALQRASTVIVQKKPSRRVRTDGDGAIVEEEAGRGIRGRQDSVIGDS